MSEPRVERISQHHCENCGGFAGIGVYLDNSDVPVWYCDGCLPPAYEIERCPCGCSIPMGSESYEAFHGGRP